MGSCALASLCSVNVAGSSVGNSVPCWGTESQTHSGQGAPDPWNVSPARSRLCPPIRICLGFPLSILHGHLKIPSPKILLFFKNLVTCAFPLTSVAPQLSCYPSGGASLSQSALSFLTSSLFCQELCFFPAFLFSPVISAQVCMQNVFLLLYTCIVFLEKASRLYPQFVIWRSDYSLIFFEDLARF